MEHLIRTLTERPSRMKLIDIAKEFTDINIFNVHTKYAITNIAALFIERTNTEFIHEIDLAAVVKFKERTLEIAQPVSYNGYLKYLRILGDYAVEKHLVSENIFRKVKLAPIGKLPCKLLAPQDLADIESYVIQHQQSFNPYWFWLTLMNCFYYTGMRRRQLISLQIGDLDFQKSVIRLRYEGSKTQREWQIPMHEELAAQLKTLITNTELITGRRLQSNDYVFRIHLFNDRYTFGKRGNMNAESITGFFKRLSKQSGIRIGAHRFRHTLATNLCNPEDDTPPDIFAAQEILGHTNLQTTRNYVSTNIKRMDIALSRITKHRNPPSELLDNVITHA